MGLVFLLALRSPWRLTFGLTGAATEPNRLRRRGAYQRPVEPFVRPIVCHWIDTNRLGVLAFADKIQ